MVRGEGYVCDALGGCRGGARWPASATHAWALVGPSAAATHAWALEGPSVGAGPDAGHPQDCPRSPN